MADTAHSDEDKYANESFENDSENEIPEMSGSESDEDNESDGEAAKTQKNSPAHYDYTRKQPLANAQNNDYVPYDSSSDDEDDVVISETIAEINTKPMMDINDLLSAKLSFTLLSAKAKAPDVVDNDEAMMSAQSGDDSDEDEIEDNASVSDETSDISEDDNDDDNEVEPEISTTPEKRQRIQSARSAKSVQSEKYVQSARSARSMRSTQSARSERTTTTTTIQRILQKSKFTLSTPKDANVNEQMSSQCAANGEQQQNNPNDDMRIQYGGNRRMPEQIGDSAAENPITAGEEIDYIEQLDDDKEENDNGEDETEVSVRISSQTPTSFNSDDYAFHMNFVKPNGSNDKMRIKGSQRKSWSFTNERMREIERQNHILLRKILTQKPTYVKTPKSNTQIYKQQLPATTRVASAAVNRKKKQRQIDLDNQVLKRKIEAISVRRPRPMM